MWWILVDGWIVSLVVFVISVVRIKHEHHLQITKMRQEYFALAERAAENYAHLKAEKDAEVRRLLEERTRNETSYREHLAERTKRVDIILERLSNIDWDYDLRSDCYAMTISFDPRMTGYGSMYHDDMQILADQFCYKVKQQILTSKFIQIARDNAMPRPSGLWQPK